MPPLPDDKQLRFVKQEERPPMSPQLARRAAMVGMLALGLFAILFFRLWFLQVLSTNQYAKAASVNFVRDVEVPAPRGEILDSSGQILASSRRAYAVEISPPNLPVPITDSNLAHPPQPDAALYDRLASVLGLPTKREPCPVNGHGLLHMSVIACRVVQGYVQLSYGEATVASDISDQQLWYISERQSSLPGVTVQQIYQRTYPFGDLASQVLGIVSRITAAEVGQPDYAGVSPNDSVGQSGLEASYDRYLRGADGAEKVKVDAFGNFVGVQSQTAPTPGDSLKLSLNVKLEQVGQQALQESIDNNPPADGGAFVAMNPDNGEVYAMGSLPTYDANVFTKPVPYSTYNALFGPNSGDPQVNRAYQGAGPTGSTFKPITATAALESGAWSVGSIFDDSGQYCFSGQCRHNAGGAVDGALDLVDAIKVSSDDFFYNLGVLFWDQRAKYGEDAIQNAANALGWGEVTGIDLPGETPDARVDSPQVVAKEHAQDPAAYPDGDWYSGNNLELAFGQGGTVITPIEEAQAYSTFANGGTRYQPEIAAGLVNPSTCKAVETFAPKVTGHVSYSAANYQAILQGFEGVVDSPSGTAYEDFVGFPLSSFPIAGKTGTATETPPLLPNSWFVGWGPLPDPQYLVAAVIQGGGYGSEAAAPVVRQAFNYIVANRRAPVSLTAPAGTCSSASSTSTTTTTTTQPAGLTPATTTSGLSAHPPRRSGVGRAAASAGRPGSRPASRAFVAAGAAGRPRAPPGSL